MLERLFGGTVRLVGRASDFLMVLAGIALALMTVHVVADVAMRIVFNSPIPGTLEIVAFYYMVAAIVFPVAFLERKNEHISVELFYGFFPTWAKRASYVFACLLSAVFFAVFAYQSWLDALKATASREVVMGAAAIQIWPARYILPISFALLVVVALLKIVRVLLRPSENPDGQDLVKPLD